MRRHILDTPKKRTSSGMKLTLSRIPREALPRRTTLALQRRHHSADSGARTREYLRIDRGYEA